MTNRVMCGFGKAVFAAMSSSLLSAVVEAPFKRTATSQKFKKSQPTQRYPVTLHPTIGGMMFQDYFDLPDGTLILLQNQHRARSTPMRDSTVFIRVRQTGASLVIYARIPPSSDSLVGDQFIAFTGRGDLVEWDELPALGITVPTYYRRTYANAEEREECFTIDVVEDQKTTAKPEMKLVEVAGKEAIPIMVVPTPRRNIRIPPR